MENNTPEEDVNDLDLDYTRSKRKMVLEELMKKGVPTDYEALGMVQKYLADMDRASLGRKRIKTDEKVGNAQAQAAAIIAEMVMRPDLKKIGMGTHTRLDLPQLPEGLVPVKIEPGELDIGTPSEDYENFMRRTASS